MEKQLSIVEKRYLSKVNKVIIFLFLFSFCFLCNAQEMLYQSPDSDRILRVSMWAPVDPEPGSEAAKQVSDFPYSYAISELKKVSPFIFSGMIYGWKFSYTPYDKTRQVKEYFEFSVVQELQKNDSRLSYKDPWFEDNKVNVYIEYDRDDSMMLRKKHWDSVIYPKISGIGQAPISLGSDGIEEACKESVKIAVRTYAQKKEKNKPKEVSGVVLLIKKPRFYIDSGRYTADLDFYLKLDKIVEYKQF